MRLRVRGPQGMVPISIDATSSYGDLIAHISNKTGVADFDVKYGYPPQPLDTESIDPATRLSDIGIDLNGEQLIIMPRNIQAELTNPPAHNKPTPHTVKPLPQTSAPRKHPTQPSSLSRKPTAVSADPPEIPVPALSGTMLLRVMPDDNSCLFRALSSAVLGSSLDCSIELRSVVAQTIHANPDLYSAAILAQDPDAYAAWIQRADSWGGGIELAALSAHFGVEVCCVNVQDVRVARFNEGCPTRCILVYSGIHYDVVAVAPFAGAPPEADRKVFDVARGADGREEDGGALEAARELCAVLRERHYFTDTRGFDVRCKQCGGAGKGEQWAVRHARETGHYELEEGSG